jgi:hypothetical protein
MIEMAANDGRTGGGAKQRKSKYWGIKDQRDER